jgi:hypothetical protein
MSHSVSKFSHVDLVVSSIEQSLAFHHLCLDVPSREIVDERAQWLREHGAQIGSGPAEYDYTPGYYAVFFYDPDGIKLERLHRPTYWEWLSGSRVWRNRRR